MVPPRRRKVVDGDAHERASAASIYPLVRKVLGIHFDFVDDVAGPFKNRKGNARWEKASVE